MSKGWCDYGACTAQANPCSGHGVCTNGTCICSPGYSGNGYYFKHRDCHIHEPTTIGFATSSLVFAVGATLVGLVALITHILQRKATSQKKSPTKMKLQRLLLIVYVRTILAGIVSTWLESDVINAARRGGGLLLYDNKIIGDYKTFLRCLFPWLIIGCSFYIVEWIVVVLPLQFLNTERTSDVGAKTATKNSVIKWFSSHYVLFDILYLCHYLWLGIISSFQEGKDICGCWCSTVIELSVGWCCLLPLFFMGAALSTLINMIYKEKEGEVSCCKLLCTLGGFSQCSKLYGKEASDLVQSNVKNRENLIKLRFLHVATTVAAYGALLTCTLIATVRPMRENPEIFVEFTMMLAHFFNILCIIGISGTNMPCRKGSPCRSTNSIVTSNRTSKNSSNTSSSSSASKYKTNNGAEKEAEVTAM